MSKFVRPAAAAKKTIVRAAKPAKPTTKVEVPEAPTEAEADDTLTAWAKVQAAIDNMLGTINKPSWMRQMANYAIGLVVYASTFYGCMALVDMLVMGLIAYTGVGFISFLVSFFAIFASFMAAFKVGKVAYQLAAEFDYDRVKSRVRGWFTFDTAKPSAA